MSSLLKKAGLIFDENKCKPFLKMSITRLNLLVNKKANHIKIAKKEIAKLLSEGKEEKARIKVEQVIRDDYTIEAYDILELHCELIANRMRFVASQKEVPSDMDQAISTVVWAADRAEISELATVKSQFAKKYGPEFVRSVELNDGGCVNPKVVEKLDCQPPATAVVTKYLVAIAEEFDVEYTPTAPIRRKSQDMSADATGPRAAYEVPGAPGGTQNHHDPPGGPGGNGHDGASGSGGGGPGATAPPGPVTAWAIPTDSIPHATATLSPQVSFGGEGGAAAGGGCASAEAVRGDVGHGRGYFQDTSGGGGEGQTAGRIRRPSGGYHEATAGWEPPRGASSAADADAAAKAKYIDAPPPYTPSASYNHNDIPSPPTTRPATFDIPAAPGYEDRDEGDVKKEDDSPTEGAAAGGADGGFDDLAARFANLRKGV